MLKLSSSVSHLLTLSNNGRRDV